MISFPCHCRRYVFTLPDDMAGSAVQCPYCRRLIDIPRADEQDKIEDDGSYRLDPGTNPPNVAHGDQYVEQARYYYGGHHQPIGQNELDLRTTLEDVRRAGVPAAQMTGPTPPHYDPQTGELIQPVEVTSEPFIDPDSIPLAKPIGRPPRRKRGPIDKPQPGELAAVWINTLRPGGLVVLGFVVLAQILAFPTAMVFFLLPLWFGIQLFILAHFVNVIDETGPANHDDLPPLLRGASFYEDFFLPLIQFWVSLGICFGPSIFVIGWLAQFPTHLVLVVAATLGVMGALLFPAVLLTCATSGSISNLRPDRLLGSVSVMLVHYPLLLFTGLPAFFLYFVGVEGLATLSARMAASALAASGVEHPSSNLPWDISQWSWGINSVFALLLGIYLMHVFCWQLGIVYRLYHEHFPWVLQRFEKKDDGAARSNRFAVVPTPHATPHAPSRPPGATGHPPSKP
jgi:hypothetical protein